MISPLAHVDPSAKLGKNVIIHPFAYVDQNVEIGDGCEIMPYASIIRGTRMGCNNKVYQGTIVGADPQDFRWKGEETYCYIGDNTVIREHVIINRGIYSTGGTSIGSNCFVMAESHIGHDAVIKDKCVVGNSVLVAGDVEVDECSILSSCSIIQEKSKLGRWVLIQAGCRINGNVPPYAIFAHNPVNYFAVNANLMRKHGYDEETIDDIAKCYRHVYQSGTSVFNAVRRIMADVPESPVRQEILDFIENNNLNIIALPVTTID